MSNQPTKIVDPIATSVSALLSKHDGDLKAALLDVSDRRAQAANKYNMYDAQTPFHLRKALEKGNDEYSRVMGERLAEAKKLDRQWEFIKAVYDEINRLHRKHWLKQRKK